MAKSGIAQMNVNQQPIYLLADSQLLFWMKDGEYFLRSITKQLKKDSPCAAYIGASNGDAEEFYDIFQAAMDNIGIRNRQKILSTFTPEDRAFLETADIVLLAGGDAEKGWQILQRTGMAELLTTKYRDGAVLVGISAGALQLGGCGLKEGGSTIDDLYGTLKLVPFIIHAHDEKADWQTLKRTISIEGCGARGIGIPFGGGMIFHPDRSVEPVRYPLHQFSENGGKVVQEILCPAQ